MLVVTKVEKSAYCRRVIEARIADGLADRGSIYEDVSKVTAAQLGDDIAGCLAGFPCQARSNFHLPVQFAAPFPAQDVSGAGNQASMDGSRTVLIKQVFRLYDESKAMGRPMILELFGNHVSYVSEYD